MLFLLLQVGKDRYALEAGQVVEVLPLVNLKRIPQAPPSLAGIFNYHGVPVPLLDLTELMMGRASQTMMSTRIVLTNWSDGPGQRHLIGLLAEQVTETIRFAQADFADLGMAVAGAPYLGPVTADHNGITQRIEVNRLLSQELQSQLFAEPTDSEK
jgi:chemotaxis-related protein WspB